MSTRMSSKPQALRGRAAASEFSLHATSRLPQPLHALRVVDMPLR